jgi:hypothetical protein
MRDDVHLQTWRWRLKAVECRAVGDQMRDPMAKVSFQRMAETYDRLAKGLDERMAGLPVRKSATG